VVENFRLDDKIKILIVLGTAIVGAAVIITALSPYGELIKNIISPPTTPSPPLAGGSILWSSAKWANGDARTVRGVDPDDKQIDQRLGKPNGYLRIDGKGTAFLGGGGGARVYVYANNYDSMLEITFVERAQLDSLSLKMRSRHHTDFGGYGMSLYHNQIKYEREDYYPLSTGTKRNNLPQLLQDGKTYTMRMTCRTEGTSVHLTGELDYGNGKFVKVMDATDPKPVGNSNTKAVLLKQSYYWIRYNGPNTADPENEVEIKKVVIRSL
jgi:hypothetical protein